nr:CDP-alcohol phosphatidyltransferase family protein [Candidatus Sigynarchaeota archaeon]
MVSNKLRHITNKIIEPIAKRFQGSRVSPNIITILGLIIMLAASAYTAFAGAMQLNPIWLLGTLMLLALSGFMDLLDGGVAKFTGQKTKFGGVLDSTVDRYADGFMIVALIFGTYLDPVFLPASQASTWGVILGFLGLVGAYMTSYVRSRAEIEGVSMAGIGWIERPERLIFLVVGIILEMIIPATGPMFYVFVILTILMHFTAYQRLRHAYKELKKVDDAAKAANPVPASDKPN